MFLEITTPDKKVFSGDVNLVQLPGTSGSFEILNDHAPLISTLTKGKIKIIDEEKKTQFFEINSGVVEVLKNKIVVLAE
jgi:F-type H+-transporting ATPase subunit epsilon